MVRIGDAPSFYIEEWASEEFARPLMDKLRKALNAGESVPLEVKTPFHNIAVGSMSQAHFHPLERRGK
jgi:hypothetical protein